MSPKLTISKGERVVTEIDMTPQEAERLARALLDGAARDLAFRMFSPKPIDPTQLKPIAKIVLRLKEASSE